MRIAIILPIAAALLLGPSLGSAKTRSSKKAPPTPLERPTLTPDALKLRTNEKLSDELLDEEIKLLEELLELLKPKPGKRVTAAK